MPIWSEILKEINETPTPQGTPDFDKVRRTYLAQLHRYTGRNTIIYASAWLQKPEVPPNMISIVDEDMQAFMENVYGLDGDKLDLVLHSPGGVVESAEHIVSYLRSRFTDIRVLVPQLAMSAATMLACASNSIVMGRYSALGPIDPQIQVNSGSGTRYAAAQAILDQFDKAKLDMEISDSIGAWYPMLSQYGPELLVLCENSIELSKSLVETWLKEYMFREQEDGSMKAKKISEWLANHRNFKSHGRHILRPQLEENELVITRVEADKELEDLMLSVLHATTHTFLQTPTVKIIENHLGRAFIKQAIPAIQVDPVPPPPP